MRSPDRFCGNKTNSEIADVAFSTTKQRKPTLALMTSIFGIREGLEESRGYMGDLMEDGYL
jgi:hypothetical protein